MYGLEVPVPAIPLVKKSNSSSSVLSGKIVMSDLSFPVFGNEYCKSRGFGAVKGKDQLRFEHINPRKAEYKVMNDGEVGGS